MSETTIALIAVAVAAVANVFLQVLAMWKAAQVAEQAKADAGLAQEAADMAAKEATKAKIEVREVKAALVETTETAARAATVADGKLDHIVILTNSTLSTAKAALERSEERVARLEKMAGIEPGEDLPPSK